MSLLILTYHYFHDDHPVGIPEHDYSYSVSSSRLRQDCKTMAGFGYEIIEPRSMFDILESESDKRRILITIDDGHQSIEDIAAEIMLEHDIRPLINIIVGRVGTDHYLSWSSIRNLAARGFGIASHSVRHANLTRLSDRELDDDLYSSRKEIEDRVGVAVNLLAVPMGRINRKVVIAARKAGYRGIMTSFTGINLGHGDVFGLRRFQVKAGTDLGRLDGYYDRFSRERIIGAVKNLVRRLMIGMGL